MEDRKLGFLLPMWIQNLGRAGRRAIFYRQRANKGEYIGTARWINYRILTLSPPPSYSTVEQERAGCQSIFQWVCRVASLVPDLTLSGSGRAENWRHAQLWIKGYKKEFLKQKGKIFLGNTNIKQNLI